MKRKEGKKEEMKMNKELNNIYRYGEVDKETKDRYKRHKELCDSLNELYIQKNKEYGNSFSKTFERRGLVSAISQIEHKVERLANIYDAETVEYESLENNLIDAANYCIMTLLEIELARK